MQFPKLTAEQLTARLAPPRGKVQMVLDTDTYNEVDDQFALAHAILSPDSMDVRAIYAAPFYNDRSTSPGDGMEKSYEEILRLLDLLEVDSSGLVYKGSTTYLPDAETPVESEAVDHLISLAMSMAEEPLYVVAIGAITNIASALLKEPRLVGKIVVVWLGGHDRHFPHTKEFNLIQDIPAARIIFDCGVPLVRIPCVPVSSHLLTTKPELEYYLAGQSRLSDYLLNIVKDYGEGYCWSKVIWDISATSWLVDPGCMPSALVSSPILNDDATWTLDDSRHLVREAYHANRNTVFRDVFRKITA